MPMLYVPITKLLSEVFCHRIGYHVPAGEGLGQHTDPHLYQFRIFPGTKHPSAAVVTHGMEAGNRIAIRILYPSLAVNFHATGGIFLKQLFIKGVVFRSNNMLQRW